MMECIALLSSAAMTFVSDSTAASRSSLRSAICTMRSSTVPAVTSLCTVTGRLCPSLWHLSSACRSICGLKSQSWMITVSAPVRLSPWPPARVLNKKQKISEPGLLYASQICCRW